MRGLYPDPLSLGLQYTKSKSKYKENKSLFLTPKFKACAKLRIPSFQLWIFKSPVINHQ